MDKWPKGRGYEVENIPKTTTRLFTWAARCRGSVDWMDGQGLLGKGDVALQQERRFAALLLLGYPRSRLRFCLVYHALARPPAASPWGYPCLPRVRPQPVAPELGPRLGARDQPPPRRP